MLMLIYAAMAGLALLSCKAADCRRRRQRLARAYRWAVARLMAGETYA